MESPPRASQPRGEYCVAASTVALFNFGEDANFADEPVCEAEPGKDREKAAAGEGGVDRLYARTYWPVVAL